MSSILRRKATRREFLGQASCAAVGSTALYSTLLSLLMTNRASAETLNPQAGYKSLVCLFMAGGNDSFNLLVPREADEYARYAAVRSDMALGEEALLGIVDEASGRRFGVHASAPELASLYQAGKLAFLCNVGTLVEPTTLAGFKSGTASLPLGLFSHSDQIMHWQTSIPDERGSKGWLGRAADVLDALHESSKVSMNLSLAGQNVMQAGDLVLPYAISRSGAIRLNNYTESSSDRFFVQAVDSLLDQEYRNALQRTYARMNREAIDSGAAFNEALAVANETPLTTQFPDTTLGNELKMVAQTIRARGPLGLQRQTFFVRRGGWDHHDSLLERHAALTADVSAAVGAFWAAIEEMGLQDQVTLFTASDFGRTLSSNGDGTDHAWGGNHFVLGGGARGGRLYGAYPEDLSLGNALDTGRGRLIPTTSVDEYFAELALWMGVQSSDLGSVLPNLDRFYDLSSGAKPLGMFG